MFKLIASLLLVVAVNGDIIERLNGFPMVAPARTLIKKERLINSPLGMSPLRYHPSNRLVAADPLFKSAPLGMAAAKHTVIKPIVKRAIITENLVGHPFQSAWAQPAAIVTKKRVDQQFLKPAGLRYHPNNFLATDKLIKTNAMPAFAEKRFIKPIVKRSIVTENLIGHPLRSAWAQPSSAIVTKKSFLKPENYQTKFLTSDKLIQHQKLVKPAFERLNVIKPLVKRSIVTEMKRDQLFPSGFATSHHRVAEKYFNPSSIVTETRVDRLQPQLIKKAYVPAAPLLKTRLAGWTQ